MSNARVFLVDDQAMLRAGFKSLLAELDGVEIVGDCGDAREALEQIAVIEPDVVLLDISMPGLSGLDAIPLIKKTGRRVKVIMLTHHEGQTFVDQALKAGADAYLSKDSDPAEMALAISSVMRGNPYLSPKVAATLVSQVRGDGAGGGPTGIASLTAREREVFQLLVLGRANKEVAHELGISLGTAKKHRENLQRKLQVGSAAELTRIAIREGLLNT